MSELHNGRGDTGPAPNAADGATAALIWQRALSERLLLNTFRAQESAQAAEESSSRAEFLASAARELSASFDPETTQAAVQRRTLPRPGSWCIVDLVDVEGATHRLAALHPDPERQELALRLEADWPVPVGRDDAARTLDTDGVLLTLASGSALSRAAPDLDNLAILRRIGFGSLFIVPLVVREENIGTITFVTRPDDPPLGAGEEALARELAGRCALALDNSHAHQECERHRVAAVDANNAKSEFISNMSHELLTPLNAIGGYLEIIDMGLRGPVTPEQRTDLARIKLNQQHLLTMIAELLSYGRSDGTRPPCRMTALSVDTVLSEVIEMLNGAAVQRRLVLSHRENGEHPVVWADANRLRQILVNLVMNAVKYAADGGTHITLSAREAGDTVLLDVSDDGPGIPADKLLVIFEPFTQLTSGFTKRFGGVGLGLAISRDLAREMEGDVTVMSDADITSFTIALQRPPL